MESLANEWQLVRKLLLALHKMADESESARARTMYSRRIPCDLERRRTVKKIFPALTDRELRHQLSQKANWKSLNRFLYLPDASSNVTPVLALSYDFTGPGKDIYFAIAFCVATGDGVRAIGMRFESPHEMEGVSGLRHAYYHAQLTISWFRGLEFWDPHTPRWIPDSEPAIPLPASCGLELLLTALISVYGLSLFESLFPNYLATSELELLEPALEKMGMIQNVRLLVHGENHGT